MANRTQQVFGAHNIDRSKEATTVNRDGFPAFKRSLEEQYLQTLMTNTMGNTYYADQKELVKEAMDLHASMLKSNPEFMAKAVIYARNNGYMRLQPIVGLAHLSTLQNKFYFKAAFQSVIRTPGDLQDFVTICASIRSGKRGLGRSVKTAINNWLKNLSEYHAIKYGSQGAKGWGLGDIIKATHPVPADKRQSQLFNYVANRAVDFGHLPQINELERLKNLESMKNSMSTQAYTKEVLDAIERGRLPYEVVTGIIKPNETVWEYLMKQMPYFALLRNLNTLERAGVLNKKENVDYVAKRLTDSEAIHKAMILPFRFHTAMEHAAKYGPVRDALREAMELSFENVPVINGNNYYFLDTSGSMSDEYLKVGGTLGIAAYMKSTQPNFMCFESALHYVDVSKKDSMATNLEKVMKVRRGGTNTGLCIKHLLGTAKGAQGSAWDRVSSGYGNVPTSMQSTKPIFCDNIIIITDEQQNAGSMVLTEFTKYRKTVNPNAKLFIIDVAPYSRALAPQNEPGVYFIYGWSDDVLRYISFVTEGTGTQVDAVSSISLEATAVWKK